MFKKDDENKPDFTQIPQKALLEVATSFTNGAKKYGEFNYSNKASVRRFIAASQRHINAYLRGEDYDKEAHHIANAIAGLMMALDGILNDTIEDDRNPAYQEEESKGEE